MIEDKERRNQISIGLQRLKTVIESMNSKKK
jgi:hypothetical protein